MTPRQLELLRVIAGFEAEYGYQPSFEEMRVATGIVSKSGIHHLVLALERQGLVCRPAAGCGTRWRNLIVTAAGHAAVAGGRGVLGGFSTVKLVDELRRRGCGPEVFADIPAVLS